MRFTRIALTAAACLSLGTSAVAAASPAQAAGPDSAGTYVLSNINTNRCVDDSSTYGLRSYPCNGSQYQHWVADYANGVQTYRNVATNLCMDDSSGYGLRAFGCNGADYQEWGSGAFNSVSVVHNAHTGLCLDDSGGYGLRAIGCNGLNYQLWEQSGV